MRVTQVESTHAHKLREQTFIQLKSQNQSTAWYAEAVDRAVIRKLEKIKTLQGFKNSADGGQGDICHG